MKILSCSDHVKEVGFLNSVTVYHRMLANRGLPAVFMLFTTAYFAAGAFYYNDGIGF